MWNEFCLDWLCSVHSNADKTSYFRNIKLSLATFPNKQQVIHLKCRFVPQVRSSPIAHHCYHRRSMAHSNMTAFCNGLGDAKVVLLTMRGKFLTTSQVVGSVCETCLY